eukprot:TRINITY_DN8488_c0_g1_i1.p1 TRINITY_DN8488_c0_g1~~TRINITY_DN8488_c0_g1_i1.p1  ORF type:complete len:764 (-),score=136.43 TRINITY_DN8488_c0_g1_i1:15-2306(-)
MTDQPKPSELAPRDASLKLASVSSSPDGSGAFASPGYSPREDGPVVPQPAMQRQSPSLVLRGESTETGAPPASPQPAFDPVPANTGWQRFKDDFGYVFYHPLARLALAGLLPILNFFIFAEDPANDSKTTANFLVAGSIYELVVMRYPRSAGVVVLKLSCIIFPALMLAVGKYVIHDIILRNMLRLQMFGYDPVAARARRECREQNKPFTPECESLTQPDKGSWMVMFFSCILTVYIASRVYNRLLTHIYSGADLKKYQLIDDLNMSNDTSSRIAACCCWFADVYTLVMVFDNILGTLQAHSQNLGAWQQVALLLLARVQVKQLERLPHFRNAQINNEMKKGVDEIEQDLEARGLLVVAKQLYERLQEAEAQGGEVVNAALRNFHRRNPQFPAVSSTVENSQLAPWPEFAAAFTVQKPLAAQMRECFEFFDTNHDGLIDLRELTAFIEAIPELQSERQRFGARMLMEAADHDGNHRIDAKEFISIFGGLFTKEQLADKQSNTSLTKGQVVPAALPSIDMDHIVKMELAEEQVEQGAVAVSKAYRRQYRSFLPGLVPLWHGKLRWGAIIGTVLALSTVVLAVIWGDRKQWRGTTTELSRIFVASLITCLDLLVLVQDWEFPTFTVPHEQGEAEPVDIDIGPIKITGKWMNYGILVLVLMLDLNATLSQLQYRPKDYNQFVLPGSTKICNDRGDCDVADYVGASMGARIVCAFPLLGVPLFFFLVYYFQRKTIRRQYTFRYGSTRKMVVERRETTSLKTVTLAQS